MSKFSFATEPESASAFAGLYAATTEYGGLLTDGWAYMFGRRPHRKDFDFIVRIDEVDLSVLAGPAQAEIGRARRSEPVAVDALIQSTIRARAPARPRIAVAVAERLELVVRREAPYAPMRLLDAVMQTEIQTLSPFPGERTRIAWAIVDVTANSQTVEALILDAEIVDPVIRALAENMAAPLAFARLDENGPLWACRPRWFQDLGAGGRNSAPWLPAGLRPFLAAAGLVVASAVLNLLFNYVMLEQLGSTASEAIESARRRAELTLNLAMVEQARAASVQRIALIEALASALDDQTYLERLAIKGDEIEFSVVSPSAADVLKAVSGIADLREAALRSSVTRDAARFERFTISARLPEIPNAGDPS